MVDTLADTEVNSSSSFSSSLSLAHESFYGSTQNNIQGQEAAVNNYTKITLCGRVSCLSSAVE